MKQSSWAIAGLSERLRSSRERRALTQAQLAVQTGLSQSAVSQFESGGRGPSPANLVALADALDVTTDFLLGRRDAANAGSSAHRKLLAHVNGMKDAEIGSVLRFAQGLTRKRGPQASPPGS